MISDRATELEKMEAVINQEKIIVNSLVGNCYQYKDHNDKYFTYVRITKAETGMFHTSLEGYKYSREAYQAPVQRAILMSLDEIKNMTKITLEEFMYNVSQYLELHDLQFIPGKFDT